jgi:inner membrane protein
LLLETGGNRYTARHAVLSLDSGFLPASSCGLAQPVARTAPLTAVTARDSPAVKWLGETVMPDSLLERLVAANCAAAAFMLFARAPFVAPLEPAIPPGDRAGAVLGDLRFDRGRERGSFEIPLPNQELFDNPGKPPTCQRAAPWVAPRADLVGPLG